MLLEAKHCLQKAHQNNTSSVSKKAAYNNTCKTVQNRLHDMQDSWLSKKAEEIQSFADRKDMKKFHDALKTIYGPKSSGATPLYLLSIAGQILAKILLNRLNAHLDKAGLIPESQCGFRKDRGTIDMIFTARQLQEKCQEQNEDLYMTFVDLTKAFDTVSRDGLWKIVTKFGCPP